MAIITDNHVRIYQETITAVRQALGRTATIYLEPTDVDCTYCVYDPIAKKSSGIAETGMDWTTHPDYVAGRNDIVCPECNGEGTVETQVTKTVLATKKDISTNDRIDSSAGTFLPATVRLSCDLNDVLVDPTDVNGETWFHRAVKVVYDGESYEVVNPTKSGLRDLYTCRVILERTNK